MVNQYQHSCPLDFYSSLLERRQKGAFVLHFFDYISGILIFTTCDILLTFGLNILVCIRKKNCT